jgi:hypothetical protein
MDVYRREIDNTEKGDPAIIIAADTIIVSHSGKILEKPKGEADHMSMLKMLRDQKEHKVMTAVAVMKPLESAVYPGYRMETHVEETTVKFDAHGMPRLSKFAHKPLMRCSVRRAHPGIRTHTRRQRQGRRLRNSDCRRRSHREHTRVVRQRRGLAVAGYTPVNRQGHGA